MNNFQKNTSDGFLDTSLAAMVTLFAVVIIASFYAGVLYEGRSTARQAQSDLQAQQQSTQRTIFWLADERSASDTRLGLQLRKQSMQLNNTQGEANAKHQTLNAGVRAGTVSVRVPVVLPASCTVHGVPGTTVSPAGSAATYAQLDPAAAADLADIPHDGDTAIRELNACISQYNTVKAEFDQWLDTLVKAQNPHAQTR